MRVVFRVDASMHIGSGHVMRCLVLAEALQARGFRVRFCCRPQAGDLIARINARGFIVLPLPRLNIELVPRHSADYAAWLQVSQTQDAQQFCQAVGRADLVVVDHYALDAPWQTMVKTQLACAMVAIDDLLRSHDAELIIDQTLGRQAQDYASHGAVLAGTQYAMLNAAFVAAREKLLHEHTVRPSCILLSMGGVDAPNASLSVLEALATLASPPKVTLLLAPQAPHYTQVSAFAAQHKWLEHIDFCQNMAELMLKHDIAIGAPGSSAWERACLGLPAIVVPLADNQRESCQQLLAHAAVLCVEQANIGTQLLPSLAQMRAQLAQMRVHNLALCDGFGAQRVAQEIALLTQQQAPYRLRRATSDDIATVFSWQSHPDTRRYAHNPKAPDWQAHQAWMRNKLKDVRCYFYLIEQAQNREPMGALRLDPLENMGFLLSIFTAPAHYGKGVAQFALAQLDYFHPSAHIRAEVLKDNAPSQRLFERSQFTRSASEVFERAPLKRSYE